MGPALATLLLIAQAQTPAPVPAAAPPADPVHMTIAVHAPDGRAVRTLQPRDLEVREDGTAQSILSVEPRTPGPRRIAIVLDEFHVSAASTASVRDAAHWFVEDHLRAGDEVSVLKPLDPLSQIHFTASRERLHDAIDSFDGRKGNYEPRSKLEADTVGEAPALAEASRAQIVLSALRELASRLGGMTGRPAIVVVSEGFVRESRSAAARGLPGSAMVERFANRFDVPIYVLSPSIAPEDDPAADAMRSLAGQTGATFRESADLRDGFRAIGDELDGGYLVTYRPGHAPDGRFHEVAITARRKGTIVRARAGYVSPLPPDARRSNVHVVPAMSNRLLHRSQLITVWAGLTQLSGSDGRVVVTWAPAGSAARVEPEAVTLKATKPDGTVLFDGRLTPLRTGPADTDARAEFDAPSGRVQLDMSILGPRGEKLDFDARDLDVPAVGKTLLLLPPLMMSTRSAREFREASDDEHSMPEPDRGFSRTERLLIRVPAYDASGAQVKVTARLLNRVGQQIRALDEAPGATGGVAQFDLSLAPLAPGDYILEFRAGGAAGAVEQRVNIRVTG